MDAGLRAGDFLVFQLEAGFALLRLLDRDDNDDGTTWHLAAYADFFPDVESAEAAIADPDELTVSAGHLALTDRAFASTQVARLGNAAITGNQKQPLEEWRTDPNRTIHDRSVRLLLGLR